jgi:hypothetical protein
MFRLQPAKLRYLHGLTQSLAALFAHRPVLFHPQKLVTLAAFAAVQTALLSAALQMQILMAVMTAMVCHAAKLLTLTVLLHLQAQMHAADVSASKPARFLSVLLLRKRKLWNAASLRSRRLCLAAL